MGVLSSAERNLVEIQSVVLELWSKMFLKRSRGASNPFAPLRLDLQNKIYPLEQFRYPPPHPHQFWLRSVKGPRRRRETNRQTDIQSFLKL